MTSIKKMDRRDFLKTMGISSSALTIGVSLPSGHLMAQAIGGKDESPTLAPNVFVSIDNTGTVTIMAHRSEMGQGSKTGLPMIVADEMEADWERVSIQQGQANKAYGSQNTDGSRSVRRFYQPMREAGAAVKEMLVNAAAKTWGVPPRECYAKNHQVIHKETNRVIDYGNLVAVAATLPIPTKPMLKPEKEFRYVGQGIAVTDLKDMVTGQANYGADIHMDGMVYAQIERCPVYGGKVKSFDASEAIKVPGVVSVVEVKAAPIPTVFQGLGGVAVIAENTWAASQGRAKLNIEWDKGGNESYDSESYRKLLQQTSLAAGKIVRQKGDVTSVLKAATNKVTAEYYLPNLVHAPMEPPACIVYTESDKVTVWAPVQAPQGVQGLIAGTFGLTPDQVEVNVTLLGGGFGRKSKPDFVHEAALLSKQVSRPVKLQWTREDEIRHGFYHSVSAHHMEAAIDKDNKVIGWLHRNAHPTIGYTFNKDAQHASPTELGLGFADLPFDVANMQHENGAVPGHVRIGWLRSVSNIFNVFASGVFADEVASARNRDPVDNLLELIGKDRHINFEPSKFDFFNYGEDIKKYPFDTARLKNVINKAAELSDWKNRKKNGRSLGIYAHRSFLSYVAMVVETQVDANNQLTVPKVYCVIDCGRYVNPDRVRSQMEGSIIFGLSLAYYGDITAKQGAIEQSNFHDYPLLRMNKSPEMDVHLVESEELPTGVGEPGVPPVAPALINSIFAATGKRIRELPINKVFNV